MIKLKCLTGPLSGQVKVIPEEVEPTEMLGIFLRNGWAWEIDYSQASDLEIIRWGRVDIMWRVFRATNKGLKVRFAGVDYTDPQKVEDVMVLSAQDIMIARDDDTGMEIVFCGPEPEPWPTLKKAQRTAIQYRIEASESKKDSFARAVLTLMGLVPLGTAGGPSVREHAALRLHGHGVPLSFNEAVKLLIAEDGVIFGPIRDIHRQVWKEEHCFGDDPKDVAELQSPE